LRLFMDTNGILRVGTRIPNGVCTENRRTPVLLPNKSKFTQLYLDFVHRSLCHGGEIFGEIFGSQRLDRS
jgi:hypothetical protein